MKNVAFSIVHGCALSLALLGIVGCAIDENDPTGTSDEVASETFTENFDPDRAAAIAKVKMGLIHTATITPNAAACGKNGDTSTSVRVNDAAFTGAANQRSGSSTSCVAKGVLQPTDDALYYCFTSDSNDFTWTYNQNLRTGVRGWTLDDLLRPEPGFTVGGAQRHCAF